jgi:mono/diheme cytochrome c family protein
VLVLLPLLLLLAAMAYGAWRFLPDEPVDYADPESHFKYGSTGGERVLGFPYWIWQVMPRLCPEHLPWSPAPPEQPYAPLGMLYEPGRDLPVGVSQRRYQGVDRVFLNCAACHTSTVRTSADDEPRVVSGMPANTFDLMAFQRFVFECAADARFTAERMVPLIDQLSGGLSLIDRYLVYPIAVYLTRDRVLTLRGRFRYIYTQPAWGPGRGDTFSSAKVLFNFPLALLSPEEKIGTTDFPSIWLQQLRRGMQLHWDGNNDKVEERNRSAAFGTGATPPTLDRERLGQVEDWLLRLPPPKYLFAIDAPLAVRGKGIYEQYCANCHGANGGDFTGERVGTVIPIAEIGTDRRRLDAYTHELAVNQATLYTGYGDERFSHFRKTFGYAAMPLDGIWLRAPYLHNGSVPTLRDMLEPAAQRPVRFFRGNDVYDPVRGGFFSDRPARGRQRFFQFDTTSDGNSNVGHDGEAYGTALSTPDKDALVEYLKTF